MSTGSMFLPAATFNFPRRYCLGLSEEETQEKERFFDECAIDPTLRDRLSILTRTFHNRKQVVEKDPLLYSDDVFQIVPVVSELSLCCYTESGAI